jgi:hypothetical protein
MLRCSHVLLTCLGPVVVVFASNGCQDRPPSPSPALSVESTDSFPAPISVPPDTSERVLQQDPIDRLRQRFAEVGSEQLLVVRARVTDVTAGLRTLPPSLYWGDAPQVVTTVTLTVLSTYCGSPPPELRVSYVGGRLADGRSERNEFMPEDLSVGTQYVLVLRRIGEVHYLELGRDDLLRQDSRGRWIDAARRTIDINQIGGLCP